jgi:hypothetical protein
VDTRSLVGVRARYVQPYEDHVLGGGVSVLDAAIDRIERATDSDAFHVTLRRTDGGGDLAATVDDVIAATGFTCPLVDLPELGVATFGASRLPAQTPWWESTTVPGIHFAGTINQGSKGLLRHGMPSNSGAVHGARYNARLLARYVASTRFGVELPRPPIERSHVVDWIAMELAEAPELSHQKGYLARVASLDATAGLVDDGTQPLAHVLDDHAHDGVAVTLEADGTGAIYPVLYVRIGGRMTEHTIDSDPLLRYDGPLTRKAIASAVGDLLR